MRCEEEGTKHLGKDGVEGLLSTQRAYVARELIRSGRLNHHNGLRRSELQELLQSEQSPITKEYAFGSSA
jgi:hypothetical protein